MLAYPDNDALLHGSSAGGSSSVPISPSPHALIMAELLGGLDQENDWMDAHAAKSTVRRANTSVPTTSTSSVTMSAADRAEKRRKHRETMVQFRLKKKLTFEGMQKQEQTLQDVLQSKLHHFRHNNQLVVPYDTPFRRLVEEYVETVAIKESLLRENRAIEKRVDVMRKLEQSVRIEMERRLEEQAHDAKEPIKAARMQADGGEWIQFTEHEAPFFYETVPDAVCAAHVRENYQRASRLRAGFATGKYTNIVEANCFGWHSERSLCWSDDGASRAVRFRFTRRVSQSVVSLDALQEGAWTLCMTPELNRRLYSSQVTMKVVQVVNENTTISLRTTPHRDPRVQLRFFSFNTRVEFQNDQQQRCVMLVCALMDKRAEDATTATGQPIVWIKDGVLGLTMTEEDDGNALAIEYVGYLQCVNQDHAQYMMVETVNMLMRWEHLLMQPRLLRGD